MRAKEKTSTLTVTKSGEYRYIYVYYKLGNNAIRINTGNEYLKSYMQNDLYYNSKYTNYRRANSKTLALKNKVDNYLWHIFQLDEPIINQKDCKAFIVGKFKIPLKGQKQKVIEKSLVEYFDEFYKFKVKELNNKPSVKDYLSIYNALNDYQRMYNKELSLKDINKEFLVDFRKFLIIPHPDGYITRGNLNDNTIAKRISGFKTFMLWLEDDKKLCNFSTTLYKFKTPTYDNKVVSLTKSELQALSELKIDKKNWQKIVDVLICNCFLGLRYTDFRDITKDEILVSDEGKYYIHKETQKGGVYVNIPINKTSLEIFKKYDFEINAPKSQIFNREIKNILEHYELCTEPIQKKRKQVKRTSTTSIPKYKLISSHTCRRTFITLAIENGTPLNSIMGATGHKKLQTLKKYINVKTDFDAFDGLDLD